MNEVIKFDVDAREIGDLYRRARGCAIDGVRYAIRAGARLADKKRSLGHGKWLPWLEANADVLGFDARQTATKLMRAASKWSVDVPFEDDEALGISREIWGNTQRALPKPQRDDDLEEPEQDDEDQPEYQSVSHSPDVLTHRDLAEELRAAEIKVKGLESEIEELRDKVEVLQLENNCLRAELAAAEGRPVAESKKRGRPKGSKNKPKPESIGLSAEEPTTVEETADTVPEVPITAQVTNDGCVGQLAANDPGPMPDFLRHDLPADAAA